MDLGKMKHQLHRVNYSQIGELIVEVEKLKGDNERLEAKVLRFHKDAQQALASVVPFADEVEKLKADVSTYKVVSEWNLSHAKKLREALKKLDALFDPTVTKPHDYEFRQGVRAILHKALKEE